jgi:hypothetical protein
MDPDPDSTSDPTPIFFLYYSYYSYIYPSYFFLITCPQAHHLQSQKFNFFAKIIVLTVILQALFQSAQQIYEKKKGRIRSRRRSSD